MAATNRETARDALTTLLETALVGTGLPAQAVYNYRIGDFQGQSPVVTVSSDGSDRTRESLSDSDLSNIFFYAIHSFVLYADPDSSWTEANAEDRLDLIEKTIADVIADNQDTANWDFLAFHSRSNRNDVDVGGDEYIRELMTVRVEKYD